MLCEELCLVILALLVFVVARQEIWRGVPCVPCSPNSIVAGNVVWRVVPCVPCSSCFVVARQEMWRGVPCVPCSPNSIVAGNVVWRVVPCVPCSSCSVVHFKKHSSLVCVVRKLIAVSNHLWRLSCGIVTFLLTMDLTTFLVPCVVLLFTIVFCVNCAAFLFTYLQLFLC